MPRRVRAVHDKVVRRLRLVHDTKHLGRVVVVVEPHHPTLASGKLLQSLYDLDPDNWPFLKLQASNESPPALLSYNNFSIVSKL